MKDPVKKNLILSIEEHPTNPEKILVETYSKTHEIDYENFLPLAENYSRAADYLHSFDKSEEEKNDENEQIERRGDQTQYLSVVNQTFLDNRKAIQEEVEIDFVENVDSYKLFFLDKKTEFPFLLMFHKNFGADYDKNRLIDLIKKSGSNHYVFDDSEQEDDADNVNEENK